MVYFRMVVVDIVPNDPIVISLTQNRRLRNAIISEHWVGYDEDDQDYFKYLLQCDSLRSASVIIRSDRQIHLTMMLDFSGDGPLSLITLHVTLHNLVRYI